MDNTVAIKLPRNKLKKHRLLTTVVVALVVIGLGIGTWFYLHRDTSLVPRNIQKSVSFPVYYPDPKELPPGYTLNIASFKYVPEQGVLYYITYGNKQRLIFTVQQKPSATELANFLQNYLPINRQVLTLAGTATEGAIGKQTVVSLPTIDKSWILITGPTNIYGTDALAQVLKSIKQ